MRKEKKSARAEEKCHMSWVSKNAAKHSVLPFLDTAGEFNQLVAACGKKSSGGFNREAYEVREQGEMEYYKCYSLEYKRKC